MFPNVARQEVCFVTAAVKNVRKSVEIRLNFANTHALFSTLKNFGALLVRASQR